MSSQPIGQTTAPPATAPTIALWISIPSVVGLTLASGLFSGLTLGLLSLGITELDILVRAQSGRYGRYAKRIKTVRKDGNWLLCTLLLGNVAVNAAMTILMDDLFLGRKWLGFVVSATLITFFGEILPQAVCSRKALVVGYYATPLVRAIMYLLAPITWPLGKVAHEKAELGEDEGRIINGALEYTKLSVADVMTPWAKTFRLGDTARLDFATLLSIFRSGNSRIPITDGAGGAVGVLFAKDLVLLDPEDETPVGSLLNVFNRRLLVASEAELLGDVLALFNKRRCHLAVVVRAPGEGGAIVWKDRALGDAAGKTIVGIVTLEDVFEAILKREIVDETDVYVVFKYFFKSK